MPDLLSKLIIVGPLVFLAGLVDSIAGGGGLISLPAYLSTGLPPHLALGTNKLSSTFGTLLSTVRFIRSKRAHLYSAIVSAVAALLGSHLGARATLALDDRYLKYILVVLLPVIAVFVLTRRDFGQSSRAKTLSKPVVMFLSALCGLVIGAYDGFAGPGTGSFLIFIYTGVIGFDLTTASGNAKIVNLSSNVAALLTFTSSHQVWLALGAPAIAFGIAGNWVGSGLAIRRGAKVIRPVFIGVMCLLFINVASDVIISLR